MSDTIDQINILVTRPQHQAGNLCHLIEQQGWHAIRFPTLKIVETDENSIKQQLETINQYQWIIFISTNAVNFALRSNNGKIDNFRGLSIAAVGKATAQALVKAGLSVDLIPATDFNTEGLLATAEMNNVSGKSLLIIRGKGGRETLADSLRDRGAKVDYMQVYAREIPHDNDLTTIELIKHRKLDAIIITSGEGLKNLMSMISKELYEHLFLIPMVVISNRINGLAESLGFKYITVTKKSDDAAIIEAMLSSRFTNLRQSCRQGSTTN